MSQFPPQPPLPPDQPPYPPYAQYGAPQPEPRPPAITGTAITGIVLASLFLICDCMGLASAVTAIAMGGKNPLVPNAPMMHDPLVNGINLADSLIKLALAGVLLAVSIGALRLARWARKTAIPWAVITLTWATIALVLQLVWVVPATVRFMVQSRSQQPAPMPQGIEGILKASQFGSAIGAWLFWCAPPVCFLLLWRSPKIVAAFESNSGQPPDRGPATF